MVKFYTDKKGRVRPITPSSKRRNVSKKRPPKFSQLEKSFFKNGKHFLSDGRTFMKESEYDLLNKFGYDVWVVSTPEGQSDYAYLIKDPEFGDRLLLKEDDVRSYEDYQDLIAELKEAPSMNEELAEDILDEFENTRGFNLAIKKRYGNLYLYDEGGVNEDISEDSPNRLRKRIREWISNA